MKILVITNLFPNSAEPERGIFSKLAISALAVHGQLKVMAPLPWRPCLRIPRREFINGIDVFHPRFFMIPKVGRSLYGLFWFLSLIGKVRRLQRTFDFDIMYVQWAYPDAFGSYLISKVLRKPIVIKVVGSDINHHTQFFLRRKMIALALKGSQKVIAVSAALADKVVKLGVLRENVLVLPSGIDLDQFKSRDIHDSRSALKLAKDGKIILFVGNLLEVKGVSYLIEAFGFLAQERPLLRLVLVGNGHLSSVLARQTERLNLSDRIHFAGQQPHDKIPLWLGACDLLCLPSLNEGTPNIILEALACGKPVVATHVGGIPDIIQSSDLGILVEPQNSEALGSALKAALDSPWDPETLRKRAAEYGSWSGHANTVYSLLLEVLGQGKAG